MATGALRDALALRKDDCYESPVETAHALMRCEALPARLWEPACGPGALVREFRGAGHDVIATDLVDYGLEDSQPGIDFLMEHCAPEGAACIVTNPPFKLAPEFARHGLELCDTVILLLRVVGQFEIWGLGPGRTIIAGRGRRNMWELHI